MSANRTRRRQQQRKTRRVSRSLELESRAMLVVSLENLLLESISTVVTTNQDVDNANDGLISLREAIRNAGNETANPGPTTITFGNGSSIAGGTNFTDGIADTITISLVGDTSLLNSAFGITSHITIQGTAAGLTIAGGGESSNLRAFYVASTGNLTLDGITLSDFRIKGADGNPGTNLGGSGGGGAGLGGAIYNNGGVVTVLNSLLSGNDAVGGNGVNSVGGTGNAPGAGAGPNSGGYASGGGGGVSSTFGGNGGSGGFGGGGGAAGSGQLSGGNGGSGGFAGGQGGDGRSGNAGTTSSGGGAGMGGAIFSNGGSIFVINSTLYENNAQGGTVPSTFGGPSAGQGLGGAIFSRNGSVTITNTTISGNIANDGRGVYLVSDGTGQQATASINNSILGQADNSIQDFSRATINGGTTPASSGDNNLIRNSSSFGGTSSNLDPLLGALQNNGGRTRTLAISNLSPAVNAGLNTAAGGLTTDQRGAGFGRTKGNSVDIGAFEIQNDTPTDINLDNNTLGENAGVNAVIGNLSATDPDSGETFTFTLAAGVDDNDQFSINGTELLANNPASLGMGNYLVTVTVTDSAMNTFNERLTVTITEVGSLIVTTNSDTSTNIDGLTSLREAIAFAAVNPGDDTITFGDGSSIAGGTNFTDGIADTITLSTIGDGTAGPSALAITTNISIVGTINGGVSIVGGGASSNLRAFYISSTGNLTLSNLTLSDFRHKGGNGGGIYGGGAAGMGGAIFNRGILTISSSTISGNIVEGGAGTRGGRGGFIGGGGGLGGDGGDTTPGQPTGGYGSGGAVLGGAGGFGGGGGGGSDISSGGPGGFGGGGGTDTSSSSVLGGFGGGIGRNIGGGGSGAGLGGAVFSDGGTIIVVNSTLTDNSAFQGTGTNKGQGLGGAIFARNGSVTITNSTLSANTAAEGGRSVYVLSDASNGGNNTSSGSGTATVAINNSILGQADNSVSDFVANAGGAAVTISGSNNLIRNNPSTGGFTGGVISSNDPLLGLLQNNGGPTRTMAITRSSLAANAGSNTAAATLTTDQRGTGFARFNGTVDIGAFEIQNAPPTDITLDDNLVAENAGVNAVVGNLSATDPDTGETFTFSLQAGLDQNDQFNINGTELRANNPASLGMGNYLVTVTVTDSALNTYSKQFTIVVTEAGSLIVTTNSDSSTNIDGLTSLREAIAYAGVNAGPDEITFGNGTNNGGTNFTDSTADTITLNGTQLTLIGEVTITGSSAGVTIDADQKSRVILIESGAVVELSGLVISGGSFLFGGGIFNKGTLTINNSTITKNSASQDGGGVDSFGTLTINNSTITGNSASTFGGGIDINGTLTINNSTITENTASFEGGGIRNNDKSIINNSTISGNSTNGKGGGIWSNDTLTIHNSTIVGNSAKRDGGGIFNQDDSTTIFNSTITDNRADSDGDASGIGGGIWTLDRDDTFTTIHNTIVAGNVIGTGTTADDIRNKNIEVVSSNNIIGATSSAGGLTNGNNGNIVGATTTQIFATGTLADNGGSTQTIAIKVGGLAHNQGNNDQAVDADGNELTTDQRGTGFTRIVGTNVDIGAFEIQNASPTDISLDDNSVAENAGVNAVVGNLSATDPDTGETFTFTLAAGVDENDQFSINGTALLANNPANLGMGNYLVTVTVTDSAMNTFSEQLTVTVTEVGSLIVTTNSDTSTNIDGLTSLREAIAYALVLSGADTITFGDGTDIGGTNFTDDVADTITLNGNEFELTSDVSIIGSSTAKVTLDAIEQSRIFRINAAVSILLDRLTFINGESGSNGGAVYVLNNKATITINQSTFFNNEASLGGAIYNNAELMVNGSTFYQNEGSQGGVIYNSSSAKVINSTFVENEAGYGGGIMNPGDLIITNSTFVGNIANFEGGGVYNFGTFTVNNSIISGNTAPTDSNIAGGVSGTNNLVDQNLTDIFETGMLADNGGPTQTIALKKGSLAFNAGDNAFAVDEDNNPLTTDQRGTGFGRIRGASVDIGAFEIQEVLVPGTPGTVVLVPDPDATSGNMLLITGTSGDDELVISALRRNAGYRVVLNGVTFTVANPDTRIVIFTLAGNDTVTYRTRVIHQSTIDLGADNDFVRASNLDDTIFGGEGDDTIYGFGGSDIVYGGAGDDRIFGYLGQNIMFGEAGNDQITGQGVLVGGDDNDLLESTGSRNIIIAGQGADTITPGDIRPDTLGDILINGTTAFENDLPTLQAIHNEWSTGNGAAPPSLNIPQIQDDLEVDTFIDLNKLDFSFVAGNDLQQRRNRRRV